MRPVSNALRGLAIVLGLALVWVQPTFAQVTTGTLSGVALDESGGVLPGADVTAVHTATGTRYTAVTDATGHFRILNVRVGAYDVSVRLTGFRPQEIKDAVVRLGEERALNFKMGLETVTEVVTVTAEGAALFNPSNTGPTSNVSQEVISNLPTISRGLDDFARLNPYFASVSIGGTNTNAISVAGRNNRYNNIQIDGAVNNDLFGLASSGAPGGQADSQPISLDSIAEIQLLVAPYDVRQGGFSGGGMNAITKSGTNSFSGTAYWFTRNQDWIGDGPDDRPFGEFKDQQFGASVGGPIKKDKVFFFVNGEMTRRETPVGWSAGGSSGQDFGHLSDLQRFASILSARYGHDVGDYSEEYIRDTKSNKIFGRLDFNLSPKHQLTIRHNWVDGENWLNPSAGGRSSTRWVMPETYYQMMSTTNSTVAQLNSSLGPGFNELRLTYQRVRDKRGWANEPFPMITVRMADGSYLTAGTEQYSAANGLDQDVIELNDDFTFTRGKHTFTVGTHNEFFKFKNLYIRDNFGTYEFFGLDNLERGVAQSFNYSFSATSDPQQKAEFSVNQIGFYAGDLWRITPRFTLTLGVRLDKPLFPDKPTANPAAVDNFGFATDVAPAPIMFSPRLGFNWDILGDGKKQLRGGGGLFAGRTPYVWLSNQYGNTGIEFTRIGASYNTGNTIPFVADPYNQPKVVVGARGTAYTNEIDVVDPDYTFPRVLRGNIAYDHDLGVFGLVGTVEFLGAKTLKDINYRNLNLVVDTSKSFFDGRPVFKRQVTSLSDVVFLTNTDEGSQWSVSAKLERPYKNGLYLSGSWIYGRAKSVNDGTSSQALSNWRYVYVPGDINNPPLAYSNFDMGHRVSFVASYDLKIFRGSSATFSLFYNGQSGRPFSVLWNTDVNGDGTTGNDLIFVPANASDVVVTNGTWDQLWAYFTEIGLDEYAGQIAPRNVVRSPWTNTLDFRAAINVPWGKRKFEVTMDVLNLINLIDSSKGRVQYIGNQSTSPIQYGGLQGGKPVYNISTLTRSTWTTYSTDDLRSRWQAQLGLRFRF